MRVTILSVGRLRAGSERDLCDEYAERFRKAGRGLGYRSLDIIEIASGGGLDSEAGGLAAKIPPDAHAIRLDEHGRDYTSNEFATYLAMLRDRGTPELRFLIGGAEGFGERIRSVVPETMAFGKQTWPHRLVRVMLAEQLYRAISIEAGLPYHKA